jgi:hypothetical protein
LQIQNSSFFAQEKGRCYYYPYCFAQFLAYIERLKAPDPDNQSALVINSEDSSFQAVAFAPAAIKGPFDRFGSLWL